jgi:acyl-CoA thioester hydrolase
LLFLVLQICGQYSLKKNETRLILLKYCCKGSKKRTFFNLNRFMKKHQIEVRVRYSETDQMGVVYHGNYIPYFEIGRVEWLRNKGVSYKFMEESGIALPIVSMNINYKKSAKYDELLTVITTFKSQSSVKIEFECEIRNESQELLTTAHFILVFVSLKTGRPIAPPAYITEILEAITLSEN